MFKVLPLSLSSKSVITVSGAFRPIAATTTTCKAAIDHRSLIVRALSSSNYTHPKARLPSRNCISISVIFILLILNFVTFARTQMEPECYTFGPYKIDHKEVFYFTDLSFAMVNLRPVLPGHVLVCPRREVKRFVDLTADETSDLWLTAQKVGSRLECHHKASSLAFTIQDGPQAGQTVPHVHIHIIPRISGDFEKNDEIYEAIDVKEKELKKTLDLDKERKDRNFEEMAQEADGYRKLFS